MRPLDGVGWIKEVRYLAADREKVVETQDLVDEGLQGGTEGRGFRWHDVQWSK